MKRIVLVAACLIVLAMVLQALFDYSRQRDRKMFGHLVHRIDTDRPVVALTLDDGPTRRFTAPLLDILDKADVTATFFSDRTGGHGLSGGRAGRGGCGA